MPRNTLRRTGAVLAAVILGAAAALPGGAPARANPPLTVTYVVNNWTGKCLGISGGSTATGAVAMQWRCAGQAVSDQGWRFVTLDNGYHQIRNQLSGKCLGVDRASTANGALAIQAPCASTSTLNNQAWFWEPILHNGVTNYRYRNFSSRKCLGINGGSGADGAVAMQWDCANQSMSDQIWHYWW